MIYIVQIVQIENYSMINIISYKKIYYKCNNNHLKNLKILNITIMF